MKILTIGDSLTLAGLVGGGYASMLPDEVTNPARPGLQSSYWAGRVDGFKGLNFDAVTFLLGTNDAIAGVLPVDYTANMMMAINSFDAPTKVITLIPPLQWGVPDQQARNLRLLNYKAQLQAALNAEGKPWIDLQSVLNNASDFLDGVHPTAAAHVKIRDELAPWLLDVYEERLGITA